MLNLSNVRTDLKERCGRLSNKDKDTMRILLFQDAVCGTVGPLNSRILITQLRRLRVWVVVAGRVVYSFWFRCKDFGLYLDSCI